MTTDLLTGKYVDQLDGVLACYDRLILTGSLFPFCYAQGMSGYLRSQRIRIFDYPEFAQDLREQLRSNAEVLAQANGLEIEFIRKKNFRKEERLQAILKERGQEPGLVHIFSAMEPCTSYKPWHDKKTGQTYLKFDSGKCVHYYFYFIDEQLGLCYLRVPTWCPFRLQFYCNGHNWLAAQLRQKGIAFEMLDNAFTHIADYDTANDLATHFDLEHLHARLDGFAQQYCPVAQNLSLNYRWSIMQAEFSTDLVFKRSQDLQTFYPALLETLTRTVKPDDIATFLGHKLHGNFQGESGNRFNRRILGTRLKHVIGPVSIKMYDKLGLILRIETTTNDVRFFRQRRTVHHRNGEDEIRWAPMRKSIYSLAPLQETLSAANQRYLAFISAIDLPVGGSENLSRLTQTQIENQHSYKGFNFFADDDARFLRLLLRGEFAVSGLSSHDLRRLLPEKNYGQISRLLKRLRVHKLIKKVAHRYRYYLTELGRQAASLALKLREFQAVPALAHL
ncbi:MAG: MarR family transcriptional regulator [Syntrophales bacterium LBB04]|nr:MarR family transcriptional regulator [Syntrophales bacterium LBB04]